MASDADDDACSHLTGDHCQSPGTYLSVFLCRNHETHTTIMTTMSPMAPAPMLLDISRQCELPQCLRGHFRRTHQHRHQCKERRTHQRRHQRKELSRRTIKREQRCQPSRRSRLSRRQQSRCRQLYLCQRPRFDDNKAGADDSNYVNAHTAVNANTDARNSPAGRSNANNVVNLHDNLDNLNDNKAGADDSNYVNAHAAINADTDARNSPAGRSNANNVVDYHVGPGPVRYR
jgi:hypothetical protein